MAVQESTCKSTLDLQELGQVVLRLDHVLDGVEIIIDVYANDVEDAPLRSRLQTPPRAATEPSAPLLPVAEHAVYGYPPPGVYGVTRTRSHDDPNGCCTIM
ncbi:hypothetical protein L1987_75366 [Smallanthus sonchifolius]|uniref:Uncharacterized protein n=1 Tax=Smallanthus sonchifolius TaxID=185202 RepID=A0ACB9A5I1_9ASTR|nr:hypothetical protein L1987_75366 [Smallanthus sonchifolius]